MKPILLLACLVLAALPQISRAEGGTCPPGYYPIGGGGVQGCAPMPGDGGSDAPDPGPQWASRWIALAIDVKLGAVGAVRDMPSKRAANKEALKRCRENGGTACKPLASTHNQCMALAWGKGYAATFGAPTGDGAINGAQRECERSSQDCKVVFGACSYPVQVR